MSLRRVAILLRKELFQGPRNVIFLWAVVAPVVLSLVATLVFGTLFSEKPRLGIADEDSSQLVSMVRELTSIVTQEYDSSSEIRQAVEGGAVDIGIVLPDGFDLSVTEGQEVEITAYVWGESLAKHRTILLVTVATLVRDLADQESPVEIQSITLGDEASIPWNDRLLPLLVLMAVFMGGMFLPATSLVTEKQNRTVEALTTTLVTLREVFLAKGLMGIMLSLSMGVAILILNQAFGAEPGLLLIMLALGAIMAAEFGLILGASVKDMTSLFATWKFGGILLFGPALIYLFPEIPQWIGRIFPTYYLVEPIVEIGQRGGSWANIAANAFILVALDLILIGVVAVVIRGLQRRAN